VPAFHEWLFSSDQLARVIVNIGGIANLTVLAPGCAVTGFDTGPGNTLLDDWVKRCRKLPFDENGAWSASGTSDQELLAVFASDPYLSRPAPKSTGRERFNSNWLDTRLAEHGKQVAEVNVAATILELTASTIIDAITNLDLPDCELIICGGGVKNAALMSRIATLAGKPMQTTGDLGLDPDFVEAAAMAWLAQARIEGRHGNRPTVTAAREAAVLGGIYSGAKPEI